MYATFNDAYDTEEQIADVGSDLLERFAGETLRNKFAAYLDYKASKLVRLQGIQWRRQLSVGCHATESSSAILVDLSCSRDLPSSVMNDLRIVQGISSIEDVLRGHYAYLESRARENAAPRLAGEFGRLKALGKSLPHHMAKIAYNAIANDNDDRFCRTVA
jgi:hypothetical protein